MQDSDLGGIGWLAAGGISTSLHRVPLLIFFSAQSKRVVVFLLFFLLFFVVVFFVVFFVHVGALEMFVLPVFFFLSSRPHTGLVTTYV